MAKRMIVVVANPYSALDADGRPQGVVMKEGTADQYVGARVDLEESEKTKKRVFTFTSDPVTVPATAYYRRRLLANELLPGDADTAKYAGISKFETPEKALESARSNVQQAFETEHGRPPKSAQEDSKKHH